MPKRKKETAHLNIEDRIYGPATVAEPALVAVIESAAVQRLRGVLQHGVTALIGITRPVTRYEHSVGVMLLVRRMGGSLQEQIAALLHDVSHTAFSHVIDYVFAGHISQSYHDEMQEEVIVRSDLPEILDRFGYDWRSFLDETAFPLLEQPAPRLCADRLDYFLRDSIDLGLATLDQATDALAQLTVARGRIVAQSVATARWLAETYLQADEASWANFREVALYELAARAIRRALDIGVITRQDLWLTDAVLWERMLAARDPDLRATLALVSPATRFVWDDVRPTFRVRTKLRTLDPDVLLPDGSLAPLSNLEPDVAQARRAYLERKGGMWPIRVLA